LGLKSPFVYGATRRLLRTPGSSLNVSVSTKGDSAAARSSSGSFYVHAALGGQPFKVASHAPRSSGIDGVDVAHARSLGPCADGGTSPLIVGQAR